ncbi:MAG: ABC transporter ATP-binding protein [Candidatus Hydrogenedentes bacterium]|nr:ABC transporter ATP-binding protein [Candidatus Hydrogenedentota bacterium]
MEPVIRVEGVAKRYSRKAQSHRGYGFTDLLREVFARPEVKELRKDEFWALEDTSFSMLPGESLALIGRNGAGKSTLLKMMNGLIKPDRGRIEMRGRVQALINLGTGFNMALTGMENIYNAASLSGLQGREIRGIVDAVVDFAELEEAIESPVETYSSGMKARLGFAIAVHLKPDILLIDEVLAVGDFAFQNKCFLRMEQLKKDGVTIVFVSHSHNMAIKLCERAIWIHRGKVMAEGDSTPTVQKYLDFLEKSQGAKFLASTPDAPPSPPPRKEPKVAVPPTPPKQEQLYGPVVSELTHVDSIICRLYVDSAEIDILPVHSTLEIAFEFTLRRRVEGLSTTLNFFRDDGLLVGIVTTLYEEKIAHIHEGRVRCRIHIPSLDFAPGNYVIMAPISEGQGYLWRDIVKRFCVTSGGKVAAGVVYMTHEFDVLE